MLFHIYNIDRFSATEVLLHGKELSNHYTPIESIIVEGVISPILFLPVKGCADKLIEEIRHYAPSPITTEWIDRTNIFFNGFPRSLRLLRVSSSQYISFSSFESEYCDLLISEFTSPVENIIISKALKGPCVIEISESKVKHPSRQQMRAIPLDSVAFVRNAPFGPLKKCSIATISRNNMIVEYGFYDGSTTQHGTISDENRCSNNPVENNHNAAALDGKDTPGFNCTGAKTFKNTAQLQAHLNRLLQTLKPDVIVLHGCHSRDRLNLRGRIVCDIFDFSLGCVRGKDFSIEELASLYGLERHAGTGGAAKTILEIFESMQALALGKELAEISGFILNKCLGNSRSERVEYTLLHELFARGYLFPRQVFHKSEKYTGGLVLDPVQGFYDNFVLLVDFNSLYPSIIQEFGVCFSNYHSTGEDHSVKKEKISEGIAIHEDNINHFNTQSSNQINTQGNNHFSTESNGHLNKQDDNHFNTQSNNHFNTQSNNHFNKQDNNQGERTTTTLFLPSILKTLVLRRKRIKASLQNCTSEEERAILNTRQQALKLTANSIYGCLGSPISRFCNFEMAAAITAHGRDLLREAKQTAQELGLSVIYGDTDSLMIHTNIPGEPKCFKDAVETVSLLISKVNSRYETIEIEFEKAFLRLLLYAKKKYAACAFDGSKTRMEMKGLTGRGFCEASGVLLHRALRIMLEADRLEQQCQGRDVPDESASPGEALRKECAEFSHRFESLPVSAFVIHTALNKEANEYASGVELPHVNLSKRLLAEQGIVYRRDDVISYVVAAGDGPISQRAVLPSEVVEIDHVYYLKHQIIPPLLRAISCWPYADPQLVLSALGAPGECFGGMDLHKTVAGQGIATLRFRTECCGVLQGPALRCMKCSAEIPIRVFVEQADEMLKSACEALYCAEARCISCNISYSNGLRSCFYCGETLQVQYSCAQFDEFIDSLSDASTRLGIPELAGLALQYSGLSAYRDIDLGVFYPSETALYKRRRRRVA